MTIDPRAKRRSASLPAVVLCLLTLLTFGRICAHEFVLWDDAMTIASNPRMNPPSLSNLRYYWSHAEAGLYVPLTYTVWHALATIGRLDSPDASGIFINPWVFHGASVLLHSCCVMLVYAILLRLLNRTTAAAIGAAIFAVHPVQVETVAWASGMKDLLFAMFSLLAILLLLRSVNAQVDRRTYCLATFALACGLLCKPTAVVTPVVALLLLRLTTTFPWKRLCVLLIPWIVLATPIAIIARLVQTGRGIEPVTWFLRPLVATDALAFYLVKLIAPIQVCMDYGRTPAVARDHGWLWWTWIGPGLVAAVLALKGDRIIRTAALVFLAGLLPILGFMPFLFQYYSTVADHYLYLPMLGIALGVGWIEQRTARRWVFATIVAVVAALAGRSFVAAGTWSDSQSLFRHVLQVNPSSFIAENNLGNALAAAGLTDEAIPHFTRALDLKPNFRLAHTNLAQAYTLKGDADAAIRHLRSALDLEDSTPPEISRNTGKEHLLFGMILMSRKEYAEAEKHFERAAALLPNDPEPRRMLEALRKQPATSSPDR